MSLYVFWYLLQFINARTGQYNQISGNISKNVRGRVKLCLLEVLLDRDICRLRDCKKTQTQSLLTTKMSIVTASSCQNLVEPPPTTTNVPSWMPLMVDKKIIQCPLGCPSSDTNVTKKCPLRDKYILTFWPLLPHRIQLVPFKLFHPMPLKEPESTSGFNYLYHHMIDLNRYLNIATILHEQLSALS